MGRSTQVRRAASGSGPDDVGGGPPTRRGAALTVGLAVLLAAGGCGLVASDGSAEPADPAASTAGPAAAGPTASPVPPAGYRRALARLDERLDTALARLGRATDPTEVASAARELARWARQESLTLAATVPPAQVEDAHRTLLTAIDELAAAADEIAAAGAAHKVCLGGSATALLSRSTAVVRMRTAAEALATADPQRAYRVGDPLPEAARDAERRLRTGAYLRRARGGEGRFGIDNSGADDAVVSLVRDSGPAISVYVRAGDEVTVTGVPDGTYRVYLGTGIDFDPGSERFSRNCGFSRFDDPFRFTTTETELTVWSVTLTARDGGNASTSEVDPADFPPG